MKHSQHLVLKSRFPILRGKRNKAIISKLLYDVSEQFKVKIYNNSLNSNHIHLLVKVHSQRDLHNFLRLFAGQVAQKITGAVRGKKNRLGFWLKPVWKRIVHWGKDFLNLQKYIYQNQLESLGFTPFKPRSESSKLKWPPPHLT
jgi:REP element-mobilizing transposase RayT